VSVRTLLLALSALLSLLFMGESKALEVFLKGSKASVDASYAKALEEDLDFLEDGDDINRYVELGLRVRVKESSHLILHDVSYPFAVTAVKLFAERLSAQYFAACHEKLVVTSLMRPKNEPREYSSPRTVHPTGMAIDLRIPQGVCRTWLEDTLRVLEVGQAVLDATLEGVEGNSPPHFHIVVYPSAYSAFVAAKQEPENDTDEAWFQNLLSALSPVLSYVALGLAVAVGTFFLLRRLVRRRWQTKRGKRSGRVPATIVLLLFLLGSSFGFFYQNLPHPGWELRGSELTALATALYWESALVDSVEGRRAIAHVIFNRLQMRDFPDTIRQIVIEGTAAGKKDGCQFSFACDLQSEMPERLCELHPVDSKRLLGPLGCTGRYLENLALAALWLSGLRGFDPTGGASHYYTGAVPYWAVQCIADPIKIGHHHFCRLKYAD
jgi:hypothetical protein